MALSLYTVPTRKKRIKRNNAGSIILRARVISRGFYSDALARPEKNDRGRPTVLGIFEFQSWHFIFFTSLASFLTEKTQKSKMKIPRSFWARFRSPTLTRYFDEGLARAACAASCVVAPAELTKRVTKLALYVCACS